MPQASPLLGGCGLPVRSLVSQGIMKGCFPLHDEEYAQEIVSRTMAWNLMPWSFPVDEIKDYFGEKFAWLFV